VFDAVRTQVAKIELDDVSAEKDEIADIVKTSEANQTVAGSRIRPEAVVAVAGNGE
jgi:hypothetical protein